MQPRSVCFATIPVERKFTGKKIYFRILPMKRKIARAINDKITFALDVIINLFEQW